ncbi:MAG: hypothetical protein SVU32_01950, partial [Candidatus Nanohaloarchaea archaeon]|nr:hypothetical protein [Candidatus Nanohaloarchaea archaeon]
LGSHEWTQTRAPDIVHPDNIDLQTIKDLADTDVLKTLKDTLFDRDVASFMAKNLLFQTPKLGRKAFLRDAQKVVPSLEEDDIEFAEGKGGVRPQIIDREENELVLGEA